MYATHILQFCFYANFAQVELVVIRTMNKRDRIVSSLSQFFIGATVNLCHLLCKRKLNSHAGTTAKRVCKEAV